MNAKRHRFVILGAAGFVAPRHMAAIKAVGGELVAACDPHDAVGVLDRYAPQCAFYQSPFEIQETADFAVICTPNHTHAELAKWAMARGMDVIMEKPAAINSAEIDGLQRAEQESGRKINCILQMRLHHDAELMLAHCMEIPSRQMVTIDYHTPRGPWYAKSWKSDTKRSGGLVFNIGVHLFDLALLSFGECLSYSAHIKDNHAYGRLELGSGCVYFDLSINGREKLRKFTVGKCQYDFTNGFDDLHIESYRRILAGEGFGLDDARPAVVLCEKLSAL